MKLFVFPVFLLQFYIISGSIRSESFFDLFHGCHIKFCSLSDNSAGAIPFQYLHRKQTTTLSLQLSSFKHVYSYSHHRSVRLTSCFFQVFVISNTSEPFSTYYTHQLAVLMHNSEKNREHATYFLFIETFFAAMLSPQQLQLRNHFYSHGLQKTHLAGLILGIQPSGRIFQICIPCQSSILYLNRNLPNLQLSSLIKRQRRLHNDLHGSFVNIGRGLWSPELSYFTCDGFVMTQRYLRMFPQLDICLSLVT